MKWNLYRHRLNKAGYDSFGHYYGTGRPIYRAFCDKRTDGGDDSLEFRAADRDAAKALVLIKDPNATFYR